MIDKDWSKLNLTIPAGSGISDSAMIGFNLALRIGELGNYKIEILHLER